MAESGMPMFQVFVNNLVDTSRAALVDPTPDESTPSVPDDTSDVTPQSAADSDPKLDSNVENGSNLNVEVVPEKASPPLQDIPECGEMPNTDDKVTVDADVVPPQAADASSEIAASDAANDEASMEAEVVPKEGCEDPPTLDKNVQYKRDGTLVDPNRKYVSQMSLSDKIAMRKLMADKTPEYREIGMKISREKKIPFPNRRIFQRIMYELIVTGKLDVANLELKLVQQVHRDQARSKKDEDSNSGDGKDDVDPEGVKEFRELRDMAKAYCESKKLPIPSRRALVRIFRELQRRRKLDEKSVKEALERNAQKEKEDKAGPSNLKLTAKMTVHERTAYFKKFDALKEKMKKVAVQHCHSIKAPFPEKYFYRICRDLFEDGQLNEDTIKPAVEKSFEKECSKSPQLTLDQLNLIVEHYCKDKGVGDLTGKTKDEIVSEIPPELLTQKHYWKLMHDEKKTNLFTDPSLDPDAPTPTPAEVKGIPTNRRKRGRTGGRNDDEYTQKRRATGNGDLRAVLNNQNLRQMSRGVNPPIRDLLAEIAEKTRLLGNLRSQNSGDYSSSGHGYGRPGRDYGPRPNERTDWRMHQDGSYSSRSGGSWRGQGGSTWRDEPHTSNSRYGPPGESFHGMNQQVDWTADYDGNSNPGTSRRNWGARVSDDPPFHERGKLCKVAIVDASYPRKLLNSQEANLIRNALFDRIGSDVVGPRFSKTYEEQGAVIFECEDQFTVTWVWVNTPKIQPWNNARLKPKSWETQGYDISIEVPKALESHSCDAICDRLEKQNTGLNTRLWNLKFTRPTSRGLTLVFNIDDRSLGFLKSIDFSPFLGFSRVKVHITAE
ncbi:hypothetical protein GE061_006001 [Apolygus lucorum]|uniref:Uncharacterized protein n=1 Tax=Apolygus lucorum TaxID=248454 RepID=A0A6A4JCF3_APOLU|nr:hypothetical protein GE061_006001 [Apolygus lucorum]